MSVRCTGCGARLTGDQIICADCDKRIRENDARGQKGRSTSRLEESPHWSDSIFRKLYEPIEPPDLSQQYRAAFEKAAADYFAQNKGKHTKGYSWSTIDPGRPEGDETASIEVDGMAGWDERQRTGAGYSQDDNDTEPFKRRAMEHGAPHVILLCPKDSGALTIDGGTVDPRVALLTVRCSCGYAAAIDRKTFLVTPKEKAAGIPSPNKLTTPALSRGQKSAAERNRRRLRRLAAAFTFTG